MRKAKATQRLVPYSENKGYASNPRRSRYIFRYQSKTQKHANKIKIKIVLIKLNKSKLYKNQCHSLCLFKMICTRLGTEVPGLLTTLI